MPIIHNQPPGLPFVQVGCGERMIDPAGLTDHQKHLVWVGIKSLDPALARMLKQDQRLDDLKQKFNGNIQFTLADFNRYLQTGLKLIEENHPC